MTEEKPQAVVEDVNAPAVQVAEAENARGQGDDLDSALATFDAETRPAATAAPDKAQPQVDPGILARAQEIVTTAEQVQFRADMNETIKSVRGQLDANLLDDEFVEGWLNAKATKDPRLGRAWLERHQKPKDFEKVTKGLARELAQKFSKLPDRQATEDREAVTAAVRGTSTRAPEGKPPDFSKMSNSEFEAAKEKLFG